MASTYRKLKLSMCSNRPNISHPRVPDISLSWRGWESVAVNLFWIPKEVNTHGLWRAFQGEGTIITIDIFDDRHGNRGTQGRIRFKPPPSNAFWENGHYAVPLRMGRMGRVEMKLEVRFQEQSVPSPVRPGMSYPAVIELGVIKLDFGVLMGESSISSLQTFDVEASPVLMVDVKQRALFVHFKTFIKTPEKIDPDGEDDMSSFRLKIGFFQLNRIWEVLHSETKELSFLTILDSPPVYHRRLEDIESTFSSDTIWRESDTWFRQTSIFHNPTVVANLTTRLYKPGQIIDIGRWNMLKITFSPVVVNQRVTSVIHAILQDHNVIVKDGSHFKEMPSRAQPVWRWIDFTETKMAKTLPYSSVLEELEDQDYIHLTFPIRYQLEVCLSCGVLSEYRMTREFLLKLRAMDPTKILKLLEHVATGKKTYMDAMEIFYIHFPKGVTDLKIPRHCCFMRTARITPSTIYYNTPSVDVSNRVTRRYKEFEDRFLRVRFTDEKTEGRIYSFITDVNDEVYSRIKRTLANGIDIGDRHYEFLAFGNSQFREHGAYFFAPLPHLTADHIRSWMGNFNHIKNIAKYAARLGQCFSTTRAVLGCTVERRVCDDITRSGELFTDGVGKISSFLAKMSVESLKIKTPLGVPPSAYQFRMGGSKGMLTVCAELGPKEVHIRPSQMKFETEYSGLEIIRWSQFGSATLNRQLILVLSKLGIKDEVIHKKLRMNMEGFNMTMTDNLHAASLLQKFVDPNEITIKMKRMVEDGFKRSNEPFINGLLALWQSWHLKGLKEKARILIEDGANVLGVIDETGVLKGQFRKDMPNVNSLTAERVAALPEIFLQLSRFEKGSGTEIIDGLCILARNPSLHPGDIRVVRAVNRPELQHLQNYVLGGDLDGDDYLVIWDRDLIPDELNWFHEPMSYKSQKSPDLDHDVTVDEITSFFVMYMKNDCLPRIAHAHMALADRLDCGLTEPKCLRLAQLHSDAVDYIKTGSVVTMNRDLQPRLWPHFMEKKHKRPEQIYHSKKILGQLFDAVKLIDFNPHLSMSFDLRILESKLVPISERYLEFAGELKQDYDNAMRQIMAQYEIKTEFEVWSGFVLDHNFQSSDYKLHESLGRVSSDLRKVFRQLCCDKVEGRTFNELAPLVVAMYRVTHEETMLALANMETEKAAAAGLTDEESESSEEKEPPVAMPLISFPWIFHEYLGQIATSKFKLPKTDPDSVVIVSPSFGYMYTHAETKREIWEFDHSVNIGPPPPQQTPHDPVASKIDNTEVGSVVDSTANVKEAGDVTQSSSIEQGREVFGEESLANTMEGSVQDHILEKIEGKIQDVVEEKNMTTLHQLSMNLAIKSLGDSGQEDKIEEMVEEAAKPSALDQLMNLVSNSVDGSKVDNIEIFEEKPSALD
ncbi:hypothetical protein N7495_009659 [Penicillium taxi]|uniref:uncharacterized protein n=1 Tax=Penicillium taxi TaxID=168475 RepID=UPI00254520BE|nr:uncharacterized protein N7495_009659 [Penicillium taxi]KAJ5885149.1 hypothetical protein N7495_009659 [Penicillium taxi]